MEALEKVLDFWRLLLRIYKLRQDRGKLYNDIKNLASNMPLIIHPWQIAQTINVYLNIKNERNNKVSKETLKLKELLNELIRIFNIEILDFIEFQKLALLSFTYALTYDPYFSALEKSTSNEIKAKVLKNIKAEILFRLLKLTKNLSEFASDTDRILWVFTIFRDDYLVVPQKDRRFFYTWAATIADILGACMLVAYNILDSREIKDMLFGETSRKYAQKIGQGFMMTPTSVLYKWLYMLDSFNPRETDPIDFYQELDKIGRYVFEVNKRIEDLLTMFKENIRVSKLEGLSVIDYIQSVTPDLLSTLGLDAKHSIFIERDLFRALYIKLLLNNYSFRRDDLLLNGRLVWL